MIRTGNDTGNDERGNDSVSRSRRATGAMGTMGVRRATGATGSTAARFAYTRASIFVLSVLGVAMMALVGCQPTPHISGSKRASVGQNVAIEVAQGPGLVKDDFVLTDAQGSKYDSSSGDVAYHFQDDKHVTFKIPKGIATGPATLRLGVQGRSAGCDVDFSILRIAVLLDPDGWLYSVDVDTGRVLDMDALGHGELSAHMAPSGIRIAATASKEAAVHFIEVLGSGLQPYSPSLDGIANKTFDAVMLSTGALVATEKGIAWLSQGEFGSTVLNGFLGRGPVVRLAGSQAQGQALGLLGFASDATDYRDLVEVVDLSSDEPQITTTLDLGGTVGGASWLVVSPDGTYAWVNNRLDNTITILSLGQSPAVTDHVALPTQDKPQTDPFRLAVSPDGKRLVVLCGGSKSAVIYDVSDGALSNPVIVDLGDVPWDASFAAGRLYVLLGWKVVWMDPSSGSPKPVDAGWDVGVGMTRLMIQP